MVIAKVYTVGVPYLRRLLPKVRWVQHPDGAMRFPSEDEARAMIEMSRPGWMHGLAQAGIPMTFEAVTE